MLLLSLICLLVFFFFFQAEDGIRDYKVTGVQTCALPILQRADHIFCLNSEDRDYLQAWLKIADHKVTRIYPGADKIYADAAKKRDYAQIGRASCRERV